MIFIWLKHNVYRIYSALRSNPNQRKILKALLSNAFKIFLEARLIGNCCKAKPQRGLRCLRRSPLCGFERIRTYAKEQNVGAIHELPLR
jgi:hypothetical protein